MAKRADLEETVNLVEKTGHRTVAEQAGARDFEKLKFVVTRSLSELDRIDFVLANAVIMPIIGENGQETSAFADAVDVMSPASTTPLRRACPLYSSTRARSHRDHQLDYRTHRHPLAVEH